MNRRLPLVALVSMLALLFAPSASSDEDGAGAPDRGEAARTKQLVAEMEELVSEIRGLEWKTPIPAELINRRQVREKLVADAKEELPEEELKKIHRILRRMKMLDEDQNILMMFIDMISGGGLGFYDPKDKRLFIVDGQDPDSLRPVIVHELIHALEDQYVDLKGTSEALEDDPDRLFAFKCMIEGSAETATAIYEDRFPEEAQKFRDGQKENAGLQDGMRTMAKMPAYLMLDTLLHYRTGPDFVGKALGGTPYASGMEPLYADQPVSEEQVLHPRKYTGAKRDYPRTVTWGGDIAEAAGEGWTPLDEMSQGELDLALWIDFHLGNDEGRMVPLDHIRGTYVAPVARTAAEGWDAGRQLFLDKDGEHIAVVGAYAFDTRKDAQEGFDAILATFKATHGEAYKELGRERASDALDRDVVDYETALGKSRILRRGDEVLLVDGVPGDTFEAVWPVVAATTFVRDVRDTWDPTDDPDPFGTCAVVDRERGIGVPLPNDQWTEGQAGRASPVFVALLKRGETEIQVMAADQGARKGGLVDLIKSFLGPQAAMLDFSGVVDRTVMGSDGIMVELPGHPMRPEMVRRMYVGSDGERTALVMLTTTAADLEAFGAEAEEIIAGIKSVLSY